MSDHITVLSQVGDAVQKFTVNTAVDYVTLGASVGRGILSYPSSSSLKFFQYIDTPIVLSYGVVLPLGFEFYEQENPGNEIYLPFIQFSYLDDNANELNFTSNLPTIPWANYEMSWGLYNPIAAPIDSKFSIVASLRTTNRFRISMIGVPASLNGKVFAAPTFAKVAHTKDITT